MGMKIENLESVKNRLSRIDRRTSKRQLRAFRKGGEEIVQLTKDNAPRDTGALEKAIVKTETKLSSFGQRKQILIGVNTQMLGIGFTRYGFDYSIEMHDRENYQLGPISQAKANSGKQVGPKYMTRALEKLEDKISNELEQIAIEESLK